MRRRHDPFLKRLYRAGTRDALTLFFPDHAARIDWAEWQWLDKEIVIRGQRPRSVVADLVGMTRDVEGRYLRVLVHPELQMQPDEEMGWRVTQYNSGLLLREGNPNIRVLTVVFYHCAGTGGIREESHRLEYYGRTVHEVGYWAVGIGDLEAEAYARRNNPMGWALAAWMRQQRASRVELRVGLIEKILRFVRDEAYQELLLDTLQTYYKLSKSEQVAEERLHAERYGEVEEMAQTVLERMKAQARREGRQEGLQQALLSVLMSRFPHVAESVVQRVDQVQDMELLETLIRRAAEAASLEEIEPLFGA